MNPSHDVIVVGAGPGGLYAAWRLAQRGVDVAVLEEHDTVGQPVHCTGILAGDAFEEFGIPDDSVLNELTTVRFCSPSGQIVEFKTQQTEALVIDRGVFDQTVARHAQAAGAHLVVGGRVCDVVVDGDGVTVSVLGREARRAKVCILACGASYSIQRRLGLGMPEAFLQSAQAEIPTGRLRDVEVHFGGDVAPRGFAWAVPVRRGDRGHVRVGVMCDRDASSYFTRMVARIAERWQVRGDSGCRPRHKILPLAPIARTFSDRLLVLGDAAGLVKPTTGGGIYYSLVSAAIAASVLVPALEHSDLGAAALQAYEERWRKRLASELSTQLALRRLAERLSDPEIEDLFELARTDGIMPIIRRTARFNSHRQLILALFRHPPARKILFRSLTS